MTQKTKINTPHDRFFHASMTDLRVAKEFFEEYLPENIRNKVNLDTLKLCKESFVEESLRALITDMLFSVNFEGEEGYLYFLSEHESKPDKLLPFWLLKYIIKIMDNYVAESDSKILPVIYPIVFYNGKVSYPYSTDIFDLFGKYRDLAQTVFLKPFKLVDLTKIPDENLYQRTWMGIMGLMMKHIREKNNLLNSFEKAIPLFKQIENLGGGKYIETILFYILNAAEIEDRKAFIELINKKLSPEFGEKTMTLAQQFRLEGLMEGRMEGLANGRTEGRAEGIATGIAQGKTAKAQAIAVNLLRSHVPLEIIINATGLSLQEIQNLKEKEAA